jgi:hypothetical protein
VIAGIISSPILSRMGLFSCWSGFGPSAWDWRCAEPGDFRSGRGAVKRHRRGFKSRVEVGPLGCGKDASSGFVVSCGLFLGFVPGF